ncbi:MAG: protein-L-isoaspartate(D-aspartate) O-methyltransferase [Bacteroidales bacterium]|jgi:protein-L-isoaspartate(D-aspartate) O-methyltransferase|nr:protein-L-isoaspartate(D-aspartate) O-methyltransferase [Bacteroidales bacterium]
MGKTKSVWLAVIFLVSMSTCVSQTDYSELRERMVDNQIIARGIKDARVISAMKKVERRLFVPEEARRYAYRDGPLSIGEGQTISQPYIVAFMTEYLEPEPSMKVLEIGTGSGYQAAILAEIVDEVYTIEIIETLGKKAKELLSGLGYDNVHVKIGDGYEGWAEHAPYDAIIVTCAPNDIPEPLKNQLAEGGRMIIPVGGSGIQYLILNIKKNGKIRQQSVLPVRFVPMVNEKGRKY